jgi:hypothetical protein
MADKDAILSFTTPDTDPFLYAVDATFSHASIAHPTDSSSQTAGSQDVNATDDSENEESYPGIFKVHPSALYHDLYVAMGSHMVAPVEIWESMRARKRVEKGGEGKSETKGHDEL